MKAWGRREWRATNGITARCTDRPSHRRARKIARQTGTQRHDAADIPSSTIAPAVRVAVVHDWLDTWRGGEMVLAEILRIYPDADLFALVDFLPQADRGALNGKRATTSFLQRVPFARAGFRFLLPLFPRAIESLDVSAYDLVISSSHAVAKGARTRPGQVHICYCYTPMRYAWDLRDQYLAQTGLDRGLRGFVAKRMLERLRTWDRAASKRVDHFVAISHYIAERIRRSYGRDSTVIYPPVAVEPVEPSPPRGSYYVTVSQLVPYKRVDLIVEAFRLLPERELIATCACWGGFPTPSAIAGWRVRARSSSPRRKTSASHRSKRKRSARR
jgi:glycosyltransferase involved in cell wall biosynthesis